MWLRGANSSDGGAAEEGGHGTDPTSPSLIVRLAAPEHTAAAVNVSLSDRCVIK